jgi:hypothetical protein
MSDLNTQIQCCNYYKLTSLKWKVKKRSEGEISKEYMGNKGKRKARKGKEGDGMWQGKEVCRNRGSSG